MAPRRKDTTEEERRSSLGCIMIAKHCQKYRKYCFGRSQQFKGTLTDTGFKNPTKTRNAQDIQS
ncbi:hypothetical protein C0J52_22728 [Blattella germanica]|nr:hypothetical protein C0J52_22728 [Blattella germanica]